MSGNLNPTKNAMRGLTVFISDLRNAQSKENEEKRITKEMAHIRKEFKENKGIDGYQRRKYVCKLLYIYMLGYDLDFGYMEAVTLLSSTTFQEKTIGYTALGMLLNENHEMIPLIINSLQEDLNSRAPKAGEFFQCLALDAIANIGGKEMAESLAPVVQKLLVANTSPAHVKKRAALSLLRLFRKYPSIITPDLWANKLVGLLDEADFGVLTAVVSLLLGLVADNSDGWEVAIPKVVSLLAKILITREYTKDYVYYSIPNPWLQTKLLRFLRHFPPLTDGAIGGRLSEILNVIFASADTAKAATVNHKNALNAVLFEAIGLVIHHDNDPALLRQTGALLGRFISAKETNIRYLGLEAMSQLASLSTETSNMVKKYQETVIISLKDADISIRRRALDLLYGMCDKYTSKEIVGELLTYLLTADYAIREELVIKLAILAEKFASNYQWYVDVILQLITLAGDFVSDDIWHRVIKIVTNHEDVQEYAARTVFKALQFPTSHETCVKVGGYILGEFGHLISEQPESSPQLQFEVLHSKFPTCALETRAMLLSTYAKFVNLFPELSPQIKDVFNQYRSFIDAEIQQRACEYFNLTSLRDDELLSTVLDAIPAWEEKAGGSAGGATTPAPEDDQSRTASGGKAPAGKDLLDIEFANSNAQPSSPYNSAYPGGLQAGLGAQGGALGRGVASPSPDPTDPFGMIGAGSLSNAQVTNNAGNPFSLPPIGNPSLAQNGSGPGAGLTDILGNPGNNLQSNNVVPLPAGINLGSNPSSNDPLQQKLDGFLRRLCLVGEGVLYEDGTLQIGVKTDFQRDVGRLMLYYGNSSMTPLNSFQTSFVPTQGLQIQAQPVVNVIGPKAQVQQMVNVVCTGEITDFATLNISFVSVKPVNITLRLPIVTTKFVEHLKLQPADFFSQWKNWGIKPLEAQEVFKAGKPIEVAWVTKVIGDGLHINVLKGVDPSINNIVAAGTFHSQGGNTGTVLVRLETNPQANMYRLTVRSSTERLTSSVLKLLVTHLSVSS